MAERDEKTAAFAGWARPLILRVRATQLHKQQENMAAVVENAVCPRVVIAPALCAREG